MGESQTLLTSHTWLHNSFVTLKQIRESFGCERWSQNVRKIFVTGKNDLKLLKKKSFMLYPPKGCPARLPVYVLCKH